MGVYIANCPGFSFLLVTLVIDVLRCERESGWADAESRWRLAWHIEGSSACDENTMSESLEKALSRYELTKMIKNNRILHLLNWLPWSRSEAPFRGTVLLRSEGKPSLLTPGSSSIIDNALEMWI
jgi:hypothetical protein